MKDRQRAREIVKAAAASVSTPIAKDWLVKDERGSWERFASDYLEKTRANAEALGMTANQVDNEIATMIALHAVEAVLRYEAGRSR